MRNLHVLSLALMAACTASAGAEVQSSPEAGTRLQEAIAGRNAEAPVACVRQRDIRGRRIIDEGTIVFQGVGNLVYVNRTRHACAGLRSWHALRTRTLGTQLCQGDLVIGFDPTNGTEYGGCTLGEFTPYRRTS